MEILGLLLRLMASTVPLNLVTCFYISLQFHLSHSSDSSPRPLIGVHPLDEKYYDGELVECKDGSKSFARNRLNDNYCDCADGTDEPGTSACPAGKFYCRNMGSTPRYLFSSRVNDDICDCCDGSDEYDGTICPNTCIRGGNIVYQRTNYESVASNMDAVNPRKSKYEILKMVDSTHKPSGLKALFYLQMALVTVLVSFLLFHRRRTRRRNSR